MLTLNKSLESWDTTEFKKVIKAELENLAKGTLPLQQATNQGGIVDDTNISALINHCSENETSIQIKVGIFFNEIVAGCNCDDDPASDNTYCELLVNIDKNSAETTFALI